MGRGVLPHVHRGQLEPDALGEAQRPGQGGAGQPLAPVGFQRPAHHVEVLDQFGGRRRSSTTGLVGGAVGGPGGGVGQAGPDVGALEPVGLVGVAPAEGRGHLGQHGGVGHQVALQLRRHGGGAGRHRQRLDEILDRVAQQGHGPFPLGGQHRQRDLGGDERVAVPVAADPGAEAEGGRRQRQVGAGAAGQAGQVLEDRRDDVAPEALQIPQHRPGLVDRAGRSSRISSVSHSSSTASASRRRRRGPSGVCSASARRRRWARIDWRADSVGWAVRTGRTSIRASSAVRSFALDPGLAQVPEHLRQLRRARPQRQLVGPVDLFGDVGGVEVRQAGPHQRHHPGRLQLAQRPGQGGPVPPGRLRPHRRHQRQRLGPLVVGHARVEQFEQRGHVGIERGGGRFGHTRQCGRSTSGVREPQHGGDWSGPGREAGALSGRRPAGPASDSWQRVHLRN